ncbi:gliding motility-associated C-terminal domain-containing protein, partial [candidate division KSB1 bacterium]|nr:gliding motility-associated C-terminal domain-containing protein [candidate division KSB1 bacterium]
SDNLYIFHPAQSFPNDTLVFVKCQGWDNAGNYSDTLYYFETISSPSFNTPPKIIAVSPEENETDVVLKPEIKIDIKDDKGVAVDRIQLTINGVSVIDDTEIDSEDLRHVKLTYQPALPFNYNDTIHVYVKAYDTDGDSSEKAYPFYIVRDDTAPEIEFVSPEKNQQNVLTNANMTFQVKDDISGINSVDFHLNVNGILEQRPIDTQIYPTPGTEGFDYLLNPQFRFNPGDTVLLWVSANDIAGNERIDSCEFYIKIVGPDTLPPWIENLYPADKQEAVPLDTLINFDILDDSSGVNIDTVTLELDYAHDDTGYVEVDFEHSGDSSKYHIWYDPDLRYNDTVKIRISGTDFAGNPMQPPVESVFYTVVDTLGPVLVPNDPIADATGISIAANISVKATDSPAGVDSVEMWVSLDSITWTDASISFIGEDVWEHNPPRDFPAQTKVYVKSLAMDSIGNQSDTLRYSFTTGPGSDTTAPWVENFTPLDSAKNVPLDALISFDILDDSGVDLDFLTLELKYSQNETFVKVDYNSSGNPLKYHIVYDPELQYNDTVWVRINAADTSGNTMIPEEYVFYSLADTTPPLVSNLIPVNFAQEVALNALIMFDMADDISGVNWATVNVKLDYAHDDIGYVLAELHRMGNHVWVDPDLQYNDTVNIRINGADVAGNWMQPPVESVFSTVVDTKGPVLVPHDPIADATGISVATNISVKATDSPAGVDSVEMWVSLDSVQWTNVPIESIGDDIWEHNPDTAFPYETKVYVKCFAWDNISNPSSDTLRYSFTTEPPPAPDTTPPWVENLYPPDGASEIPIDTVISFHILDDQSGVNLDSVRVELDYARDDSGYFAVNLDTISGDPLDYFIRIKPDRPRYLYYNDTVKVRINGADFAGNTMDTVDSIFYTEVDTTGPTLIAINPQAKEDSVSVLTNISVKVTDHQSGVKDVKLWLSPNGVRWDSVAFSDTTGDIWIFDPADSLPNLHEMFVRCLAWDSLGNLDSLKYAFTTENNDTRPPWITLIKPDTNYAAFGTRTPDRYAFQLEDDFAGIDLESIYVLITRKIYSTSGNETEVKAFGRGNKIDTTSYDSGRKVSVKCEDEFEYNHNDSLSMIVQASDKAGNAMADTFAFFADPDWDKPFCKKAPNDTIDLDTEDFVTFIIKDATTDLMPDSFGVWLKAVPDSSKEDFEISDDPDSNLFKSGKVKIDSTRINTRNEIGYKFLSSILRINQIVGLRIKAADSATPDPNKLDTTLYFYTKIVNPDLSIAGTDAGDIHFAINKPEEVITKIKNEFTSITDSIDLKFSSADWKEDIIKRIGGTLEPGEIRDVPANIAFSSQGIHKLIITVNPDHKIAEETYTNNSDTIEVNVSGGKLVVKSNPFTPNGDGLNDVAYFFCESFKLENGYIKIFNLRGQEIRELIELDGKKRYTWDGRSDTGEALMPGLYLYVLRDGGETLASGCVVLAR